MAAADTAKAESDASQDSIFSDGLFRISGATRVKAAGARQERGHSSPVSPQKGEHERVRHAAHERCPPKARASSSATAQPVRLAAPGRAITRKSTPAGHSARRRRKNSRIWRLTRLRVTEFPTLPLTVIPKRDSPPPFLPLMTTKDADWILLPDFDRRKNSRRLRRRADCGSRCEPADLTGFRQIRCARVSAAR